MEMAVDRCRGSSQLRITNRGRREYSVAQLRHAHVICSNCSEMGALNSPSNLVARQVATLAVILMAMVSPAISTAAPDQARVTKIVREVKLLPEGAKAKPANLNDKVNSDTGVKTGDQSRSELTFVDLTIERLGSNTLFHFTKAGRSVELDSGSMLLRVPKDSGGAQMQTRAVTVGVTGTTLILETTSAGRNKVIMLEGTGRVALKRNPRESVNVRGGQMEDVPAGATKLPPPVNINLNDVMRHHPLITDFPPLPSQDLINQTAQNPPVTGEPAGPGPVILPPIVGGLIGVPGGIGPGPIGGGTGHHPNRHPRKPTDTTTPGRVNSVAPTGLAGKPTSTPIPKRKPKKTG